MIGWRPGRHTLDVCQCGNVIRQCRCASPDKVRRVVCSTCPKCADAPKPDPDVVRPIAKE